MLCLILLHHTWIEFCTFMELLLIGKGISKSMLSAIFQNVVLSQQIFEERKRFQYGFREIDLKWNGAGLEVTH